MVVESEEASQRRVPVRCQRVTGGSCVIVGQRRQHVVGIGNGKKLPVYGGRRWSACRDRTVIQQFCKGLCSRLYCCLVGDERAISLADRLAGERRLRAVFLSVRLESDVQPEA